MKKLLGLLVIVSAFGLMGAYNATQVQLLVTDGLRQQLKFEYLGAAIPGGPERFKVSEGTMLHLRKFQVEGRVLEVDAAGVIIIR
jgi:hypothetical protein